MYNVYILRILKLLRPKMSFKEIVFTAIYIYIISIPFALQSQCRHSSQRFNIIHTFI